MDLDRPTDKISIAQYTALTATGLFFSRYVQGVLLGAVLRVPGAVAGPFSMVFSLYGSMALVLYGFLALSLYGSLYTWFSFYGSPSLSPSLCGSHSLYHPFPSLHLCMPPFLPPQPPPFPLPLPQVCDAGLPDQLHALQCQHRPLRKLRVAPWAEDQGRLRRLNKAWTKTKRGLQGPVKRSVDRSVKQKKDRNSGWGGVHQLEVWVEGVILIGAGGMCRPRGSSRGVYM